jgi:hypothetical protein
MHKVRLAAVLFCSIAAVGQSKPRARDLGVPFDGNPGPLNAITDVKGVEVRVHHNHFGRRAVKGWRRAGANWRNRHSAAR